MGYFEEEENYFFICRCEEDAQGLPVPLTLPMLRGRCCSVTPGGRSGVVRPLEMAATDFLRFSSKSYSSAAHTWVQ